MLSTVGRVSRRPLSTLVQVGIDGSGGEIQPVYFQDYVLKLTRLPSGFMVASIDTMKDISHIGLVFNTGMRNETPESYGITQRIRSCIGMGSENLHTVDIGPMKASLGADLSVQYTRENILLSMSCPRYNSIEAVELLGELGQPAFQSWTLSDKRLDVEHEVNDVLSDPANRAMDLLHAAAYGTGGLANPLVWEPAMVTRHNASAVTRYVQQHITTGNAGLVGLGVEHETLLRYATDHLLLPEVSTPQAPVKAKFHGGDRREADAIAMTYGAIATEAASLHDLKGLCAQAVLTSLLIAPPTSASTLRGRLGPALMNRAIESAIPYTAARVYPINIAYSDSGLFGFRFRAAPGEVNKVLKACLSQFRQVASGGVGAEEFQIAKKHASLQILANEQYDGTLLESMGIQLMARGIYTNPHDVLKTLGEVQASDVQQVAKSMMSKKLAMGAVGNVEVVPHLQDLVVA